MLVHDDIKARIKSQRMRLENLDKKKIKDATARNVYIAKLCSLNKVEKFVAQGNEGRGYQYKVPKVIPLEKKELKDEKGTILK